MEQTFMSNDLRKQKFKKVGNTLFVLVRAIVLAGICYYILYPLVVKLSMSIMAQQDLYDSTVALIPRNFSFETIKYVWKMLDYPSSGQFLARNHHIHHHSGYCLYVGWLWFCKV